MHTRLLQTAEANEKLEKREEVRMAGSWSDWSEAHSASRWDQYIQGCLGKQVFGWLRVRQHGGIARIRAARSVEGKLHVLLPRRARKRGEGGPPHSWVRTSAEQSAIWKRCKVDCSGFSKQNAPRSTLRLAWPAAKRGSFFDSECRGFHAQPAIGPSQKMK
jgi:hypothetical protein